MGATPPNVTVPVELLPPVTLVGERLTLMELGGLIERAAVLVPPSSVAVTVAVALAETAVVPIVNVAVVAPAATVTEAGTVQAARLLVSATTAPPVGAAALIVTVPVADCPPVTELGEIVKEEGVEPR